MPNPARPVLLVQALVVAAALVAGCASTRLTSVYAAPDFTGGPFDRLMIVGIAPTEAGRVLYENAFADRLAALGAIGIGSANVFPSQAQLSRETVGAWVREHGIGGVLVTRLQDVKRQERYVPPTTAWDLYGYYGYWSPTVISTPGYTITETTVVLETSLFDATTGKLVYSAVSESFQPSSRDEIVRELVDALTKDLQQRGLLVRPAGA
jgi:hypothetical protein